MFEDQRIVEEFNRKFLLPRANPGKFRRMSDVERKFRADFILEEAKEFVEAAEKNDTVGMMDALCDLLYVVNGTGHYMGLDLEPFYREVHKTNMLKTGGPTRPDGKILKPPGWQPPQIGALLRTTGWMGD